MRSTCRPHPCILLLFGILAACGDSDPVAQHGAGAKILGPRGTNELVAIHLGTLGGESTEALDVNDRGQVVGWSHGKDGAMRPFIWSADEGMRDLGTLGGDEGVAMGLNDRGTAVGWSRDAEGGMLAVRWDPGKGPEALPLHPYGPPMGHQAAVAINQSGEIVGWTHGEFLARWGPDGTALGMAGCPTGYPSDINDAGMVVGIALAVVGAFLDGRAYSGFVWWSEEGGCRERLLIDDAFVATDVMAVNNRGMIVGFGGAYEDHDPPAPDILRLITTDEPFTWSHRWGFRLPPTLPAHPTDVNDRGTIVGDGIEAINNLGDRVGGAYLWTIRPDRFEGLHGRVAEGAPAAPGSIATLVSPRPERNGSFCPPHLARLVGIGALPECPLSAHAWASR